MKLLNLGKQTHRKLALLLIMTLTFISGCTQTTQGLWKDSNYHERIDRFLATDDGRQLVFVGRKHHYIFDNDSSLREVLLWKHRGLLRTQISNGFTLKTKGNVSGTLNIICKCGNATDQKIKELRSFGFSTNGQTRHYKSSNIIEPYTIKIRLNGKRYATGNLDFRNYYRFKHAYNIKIKEPFKNGEVERKVLLTPIAIAADGIATIGYVGLHAIALPFIVAGGR